VFYGVTNNGRDDMTAQDLIQARNKTEAEWRAVSKQVTALSNSAPRGSLGLTADSVRSTAEWQELRQRQAALFARLRKMNEAINKMRKMGLAA
jgi:hypothetical protein